MVRCRVATLFVDFGTSCISQLHRRVLNGRYHAQWTPNRNEETISDFLGNLLNLRKKIVEASEAIQAEIDKHTPDRADTATASTTTAEASALGGQSGSGPLYLSLYERHVQDGCPDPLKLLTVAYAARLMGCMIAEPVTTGEEEYIGCHYGCADDRSMYVALTVSALMPWDFIRDEVMTQPAPRAVGDEALVADDHLYVRQGDQFFWIYGRGVDQDTIYRIADHVAAQIAA